jgi:hypothetical protein
MVYLAVRALVRSGVEKNVPPFRHVAGIPERIMVAGYPVPDIYAFLVKF